MLDKLIPLSEMNKAKFKLKVASLLQYTLCGVPCVYYGDEAGMQGYSDPLNRKFYPWGNEDNELIEWYKFLGVLRHGYSAFCGGEFKELYASNGIYVFTRKDNNSELLIAVNLSQSEYSLCYEGSLYDLISCSNYESIYILKPNSFSVMIKK